MPSHPSPMDKTGKGLHNLAMLARCYRDTSQVNLFLSRCDLHGEHLSRVAMECGPLMGHPRQVHPNNTLDPLGQVSIPWGKLPIRQASAVIVLTVLSIACKIA